MHQPLTQNLYLYVGGNPVNYVDPSGHSWLGNAWNSVVNTAKKVVNTVVSAVKSAAKAVSSAVSKVVSTVKNVVNNVIVPAVANVANAVKNTISKAVSHVVNGVQKVIDSIDDAINGAPSSGAKRGESILGTKMDMDVKTLIGRNRLFCSADTQRASNKNNSNNVAAQMIFDRAILRGDVLNWKTAQDILSYIWMIAITEPTFWGEIIAVVVTVVIAVIFIPRIARYVYNLWVAFQAVAAKALARPSNVPADYLLADLVAAAITSAISKGFHYYSAIRAGNAIWVSPLPISKPQAQVTIMLNSGFLGVMAAAEKYARGLCMGLGGDPILDSPTACSGYWPHYHARNALDSHCWFI